MRKSPDRSESNNVTHFPGALPALPVASPRRTLAPIPGNMTCLVLVKHRETEKALYVSDNGIESTGVWCPRSMLIVDPKERGSFIVATLPKFVAEGKRLYPRYIDADALRLTPEQAAFLQEAEALAARKRNQLRNHRDPLPFPGRNAFA